MAALAILWTRLVERARGDERGASVVEYALLASLIAVVCMVAISALGFSVVNKLNYAISQL